MTWKKVPLSSFLKVRDNRYKPNDVAIKTLQRVDKIDFSGNLHLSNSPSNTDMILVKQGDLLISGINVYKGAIIVYEGKEDITATIHYSSYEFDKNKIDKDFLKLFLKSPVFLETIKEQAPGGIKTEIKPKHLLPLKVSIPDLMGQKEIIKEYHKFESQNNNLTTELTHQLDLLRQLRQSFLREAMQGKLVPQNPKDEPAAELLKKIQTEKTKANKKEKRLQTIKADEIPYQIPENWIWCRLGDISLRSEAGKSLQCEVHQAFEYEWGVIKTSAITSGKFIETENKRIPKQNEVYKSILILKGDLIFCRASGSKGLAGKSCLVTETSNRMLILSDKTIRYSLATSVSKLFVQFFNSSKTAESYYLGLGTGKSTSMNNITREQFNDLPIPLPPLAEQNRIVAKLEQVMQLCDTLEASIKQSQQQAQMLMQAALKEASQPKKVEVENA